MKYFILALVLFAFPGSIWAEDLQLFPQEWDFGDVVLGEFGEITIRGESVNRDASLIMTNVFLETSTADFTLESIVADDGRDPPVPGIYFPGGFFDVTVRFTPSSLGPQSADLVFWSDDHTDPEIEVTLTGNGVSVVPEPSSVVLWSSLGLMGIAFAVWRRSRS